MKKVVLGLLLVSASLMAGFEGRSGGLKSIEKADKSGNIQYYIIKCNNGEKEVYGYDYSKEEWRHTWYGYIGKYYNKFSTGDINQFAYEMCK